MLLVVVEVGESFELARRLAIPEDSLRALVDRRGAMLESSTLAMGVLVRCEVLSRHTSCGHSTRTSVIKVAQIFDLITAALITVLTAEVPCVL